jgi:hypothetical protein
MIHDYLLDELDKVALRIRQRRFWTLLAAAWLAAAAVGGVLCYFKMVAGVPAGLAAPLTCLIAAGLAVAGAWLAVNSARKPDEVARRVEAAYPELKTCLLAAVEQRPELPGNRFGYLQASVIREALDHARRHSWSAVVSQRSIVLAALANAAALLVFIVALAAVVFTVARPVASAAAALADRGLALGSGFAVTIEPGNTEAEAGTSVLVLARVTGRMPAEATLVYQPEGGEEVRLPMAASLDDPVFGGRISLSSEPVEYHVELGGQTTPTYRIVVFEYPRLDRADARLVYPDYTELEPRLIQDVRTVSAIEGTELTIICRLNKPVTSAMLVDSRREPGLEPLVLRATAEEPAVVQATLKLQSSRRLDLRLIDGEGRKNVQEAQFSIHVIPNQPPTLKPTFPAKDLEVSALEELDVKATAFDDVGLVRVGVIYSLAGGELTEVVLAEKAAARQKHELTHAIRLEDLGAEPDQLLSYYWWAEDHDAAGVVRRTEGDMYFAEVRPFEEIFRQGQPPPGGQQQQQQQGQGQNAQDAQQLAQLQKEIMNATWKLIRREIGPQPTAALASDAEQVQLSQASALEQAAALAQRLTDEKSQEHIEAVLRHMQASATHLQAAHDGPAAAPLKSALPEQQAAMQALLKLRAREHEVIRQQQRGSQSQQRQNSSRSRQQQEQLNQLELSQEQNRYETQRAAQEQQQETAADRENRQALNRLRELARRQHDLNERLKELQSALEEARTEEQKEEIRRQLKRLQEEQRQILQDTDELQSRLDQPANAEQMSEERQQLDETRDNVRRASEALEQEQVTRAAASGTRAEQQFENLREQFRRRAANRFSEEVQQMRQAAEQLDERQQAVSEQLQVNDQPNDSQADNQSAERQKAKSKTLREDKPREDVAEELSQQRERLSSLQNAMRETIQEAEETEPLLSERLYDAARGIQERQLDRALEATERSVRQGLAEDARQQEQAASEGIRQLREGIERASEAVLGDETEALREARQQLEDLSRELDQEVRRNSPDGERTQDGQRATEGQPPGRSQQGQSQQGQPQPSQPQEGPPQEGQRPADQSQEGQQQQGQQQGQQPDGQQRQGQQQSGQQGNQQGERQQGEQQLGGQEQSGQQQSGQQQSAQQQSAQQGGRQQQGQQSGGEERSLRPDQRNGQRPDQFNPGVGGGTGNERQFAPLTGGSENFRDWSDRLRDVEEMVQDPELRAEAARIRERARAMRADVQRHSAEPNWDLVQQQVAGPLFELRDRVAEELLRRTAKKAIVPLDRDPVPPQFSEKTRRYYEQLGSGR